MMGILKVCFTSGLDSFQMYILSLAVNHKISTVFFVFPILIDLRTVHLSFVSNQLKKIKRKRALHGFLVIKSGKRLHFICSARLSKQDSVEKVVKK